MKRITGMLLVAGIVAFVAVGCGSSSSTNGTTPSATPSATSAQTLNAMTNAMMWMNDSMGTIAIAVGSTGASVKVTEATIDCTGTSGSFECTIWDALGSATSADHKCDVTGSYSESLYTFDLAYDCYTYEPVSDVMVDGNWTASITINYSTAASASAKNAAVAKEDTSSCDVEDIADACGQALTMEGGSCSVECESTSACSEAAAVAMIGWTVGSRGVNMTDECGSYDIAVGTTSLMALCIPSSTQFLMSLSINGTINNTAIDENIDVDCTMTN